MKDNIIKVYQGTIIEDEEDITLLQLCDYCRLAPEEVIDLVNEGILEPSGRARHEWRFSFTTVERVRKVNRLRRDFELNLAGVALVLHLLDRIEKLESRNRRTST